MSVSSVAFVCLSFCLRFSASLSVSVCLCLSVPPPPHPTPNFPYIIAHMQVYAHTSARAYTHTHIRTHTRTTQISHLVTPATVGDSDHQLHREQGPEGAVGRRGTSFGGLGFHYLDVSSDEEFDLVQGWGEGVGALTGMESAKEPKATLGSVEVWEGGGGERGGVDVEAVPYVCVYTRRDYL